MCQYSGFFDLQMEPTNQEDQGRGEEPSDQQYKIPIFIARGKKSFKFNSIKQNFAISQTSITCLSLEKPTGLGVRSYYFKALLISRHIFQQRGHAVLRKQDSQCSEQKAEFIACWHI